MCVVVICDAYSSVCFFFFSSRRRHTRFDCDWSSDVCSSDLFREDEVDDIVRIPCRVAHPLRPGDDVVGRREQRRQPDRKSTRLNSSHSQISYAVFCLKKKKQKEAEQELRQKQDITLSVYGQS